MTRVTIRIEQRQDERIRIVLVEEDGRETAGEIAVANLIHRIGGVDLEPGQIAEHVQGATAKTRQEPSFQELGFKIYDWLFPPGPVRARWDELCQGGYPWSALDVRDPDFARLPLEMACSPLPEGIQIAAVTPFQRREMGTSRAARCSPWPFRILFVLGCLETGEKQLGIKHELKEIKRCFVPLGRSVDVQYLQRPTRAELRKWVETYHPHVFHFAGHGGFEAGEFGLNFDSPGGGWIWKRSEVQTDLVAWNWRPTFVFLNACRSSAYAQATWSVQSAFLNAGVQAVLGMQTDVGGVVAGKFAAKVYEECATGNSLELAVLKGRSVIRDDQPNDGWIPVLGMQSGQNDLKLFTPLEPPSEQPFQLCREFERAKFFANCDQGRREFIYWLKPAVPPTAVKNIAVLTGAPRSGKSHLLRWCMESWVLADVRVRYIEIHGSQTKTFLSVLRQIRDGDSDGTDATALLHGPLPEKEFRRFNWELNNYIDSGGPGEWKPEHGANPVADDSTRPLTPRGEKRLEGPIGSAFLAALKAVAAEKPLVLVFDHLTGAANEKMMQPAEFQYLAEHVLKPIANDANSRIKVVIVANDHQRLEFGLERLPIDRVMKTQLIQKHSDEELAGYAVEMLRFVEESKVVKVARSIFEFEGDQAGLTPLESVYVMIESRARYLLANVGRMR